MIRRVHGRRARSCTGVQQHLLTAGNLAESFGLKKIKGRDGVGAGTTAGACSWDATLAFVSDLMLFLAACLAHGQENQRSGLD